MPDGPPGRSSLDSGGPILVVDDDAAIRQLMRLALEDEGYEVVLVANGAEALAAIRARPPRLILLDVRMPGMNGYEFGAAYRTLPEPRAPVVVVTAGRDAADKADAVGADGYLTKPFDVDDLLAIVSLHAPP